MDNVIIIFGCNHVNTLGLIRSVGRVGLRPVVLLEPCSLDWCTLRFSKYIGKLVLLRNSQEGIEIMLRDYANLKVKPIVLVGSDAAISALDNAYDRLKEHFVIFNAAQAGRINLLLNKVRMSSLAHDCGLTTIKTWEDVVPGRVPKDIVYPCIIKQTSSLNGSKEDIHVCRTQAELLEAISNKSNIIVQEYIDKEYELCVNGLSINHGENVLIPAVVRKIRETHTRQSDYIVLEQIPEDLSIDAISRFVKAIGYEGLFSVEFVKNGGYYYFLEINMRNDGTNYLYTTAGVNLAHFWILYGRGEIKSFEGVRYKLRLPCYLMQEADRMNYKTGRISFAHWLMDLSRVRAFFTFNLRDPLPFVYSKYIQVRIIFGSVKRKFILFRNRFSHLVSLMKMYSRKDGWRTYVSNDGKKCALVGFSSSSKWHDKFCADPFLFRYKGKNWLFYETVDKNRKGVIGCFEEEGGRWRQRGKVLEQPWHLSYPQVFEEDGHVYMIPEESNLGRGTVNLYEATDFPRGWVKRQVLIGRPFADATILKYDGHWYMACYTIPPHESAELWHSNSLFGPWERHPMWNKINQSKRLRRCGGRYIIRNGQLKRIAQDCNGYYGKRIFAIPVLEISPVAYREGAARLVCDRHSPPFGYKHTYNELHADGCCLTTVDVHCDELRNPIDAARDVVRAILKRKMES